MKAFRAGVGRAADFRVADADAALLVDAIIHGLAGRAGSALEEAVAEFSAHASSPGAAVECVSLIRQAVLDLDGAERRQVDEIVDRVLVNVVERLFLAVQEQALTDPLTGLGNRRALDRDLQVEAARSARTGAPLCVVVLDVDGLKHLNDTLGHQAGDDALRALAGALRAATRRSDRAYRHGGDEFALLLASDSAVSDAQVLERRIRDLGAPSCSLGLATSPNDPIDNLLAIADGRLYAGRRAMRASHNGHVSS